MAAKKATKKKVAPKKSTKTSKAKTTHKVAKKKPAAAQKKLAAIKAPFTKSQMISHLSEATELTKPQVKSVLEELGDLIERHVKDRAAGEFTLPGILKMTVKKKPAKKARKGINPFTGEETIFKAKPASKVVKIKPLKKLKDMVA